MPANFSSNNNDIWKINSSNLVMNSSKIKLNKKKKDEEILESTDEILVYNDTYVSIASLNVIPNDDIDLPMISRFLYIGKKGFVSFLNEENSIKTIFAKKDSSFFDLRIKRILFTNTTASDIIVLF